MRHAKFKKYIAFMVLIATLECPFLSHLWIIQPPAMAADTPAGPPGLPNPDPWPRQFTFGNSKLLVYQPQLEKWDGNRLDFRSAVATQLLNADAALVTIQDLSGHSRVRTTQRYCRVSNLKVQRDYQLAIGKVIQRQAP